MEKVSHFKDCPRLKAALTPVTLIDDLSSRCRATVDVGWSVSSKLVCYYWFGCKGRVREDQSTSSVPTETQEETEKELQELVFNSRSYTSCYAMPRKQQQGQEIQVKVVQQVVPRWCRSAPPPSAQGGAAGVLRLSSLFRRYAN